MNAAEGTVLQPFTIHDLLSYRKCPKAMALRRNSAQEESQERIPLSADAAFALREFSSSAAEDYLLGKTVRKNHALARADLLVRHADGWELLLDSNSLHLREAHIWEAAFSAHVFSSAGYPVRKITALLIAPDYTRGDDILWKELYIEQDITERALAYISGVKQALKGMMATENNRDLSERDLFENCLKPRECPFWTQCSAPLPKPNVFSIVGMSNRRKFQLYRKKVIRYADCLAFAKLMKPQKMQVQYELDDKPVYINKAAISKFVNTLWYPVRFLDFESFQPAIPPYIGMRPYTQCAFLYSLHGLDAPGCALSHTDFFVPYGTDPRRQMAEKLCADIPANACVAVYSSGLEKNVVLSLAELYPDLRTHLKQIAANMRDLLGPFRDRLYYDKRMQGSCSLKHVLPAIDPSLSYEVLAGVQNGEEAMLAYEKMQFMKPQERAKTEKRLRDYCAMDTMAMVKIWKTLENSAEKCAQQR